ncbi:MAG: right-handed parallel beta-helix repeat-containing protein, partial [Pirellula sp.]|nr:right-handed parallel beta-helix repeat-containing protein [Pirellula sp.]
VENCEFSDNASDPDFGWGESKLKGGVSLNKVTNSKFHNCRANRNWNNCELKYCSGITIDRCDFSMATNTCLCMRASSHNVITNCNLSHGIRISPGEVHARDSTCVLVEGGCHHNQIRDNDCRFGGDGIFIRAVGSSVSTGNLIEGNDCSFAHNNAIECGSPGNRFIRNKANHSSYGMWMGGSDQTEIIDNEANFNGLRMGYHNSPHLPNDQHAGIVLMFATAEHLLIRGNRCVGNNGAGIALLSHDTQSEGRLFPTNIVIENNLLIENQWGVFLADAQLVSIRNNLFLRNKAEPIVQNGTNGIVVRQDNANAEYQHKQNRRITGQISGSAVIRQGATTRYTLQFDEALSPPDTQKSQWEWIVDGTVMSTDSFLDFTPSFPGTQTIAVRFANSGVTTTDWFNVAVLGSPESTELGADPKRWTFEPQPGLGVSFHRDTEHSLDGNSSLRIEADPYHGARFFCQLDLGTPIDESLEPEKLRLSFWFDSLVTETIGWQDLSPEITLTDSSGKRATYRPSFEILSPTPEKRHRIGWKNISFNLTKPKGWSVNGDSLKNIRSISFGFDTWGESPIKVWLDEITLESIENQSAAP